ncbi:hypothetical protein TNCV_3410171 [Trichonephila clavipes]|nr:hypothetical protein TNCV_3410171 [Trichonephila clavipes]
MKLFTNTARHIHNLCVYIALSRVTAQEGLHIVPTDGRQCFYHGRRKIEAIFLLRNEFTRRSSVHLTTINQIMINRMNEGVMILFSLSCQSHQPHVRDLRGNIVQKAQYQKHSFAMRN